jgi:hypothetical protein
MRERVGYCITYPERDIPAEDSLEVLRQAAQTAQAAQASQPQSLPTVPPHITVTAPAQ